LQECDSSPTPNTPIMEKRSTVILIKIHEYGLAKSSSSWTKTYKIHTHKFAYNYVYTGSMGRNNEKEQKEKKLSDKQLQEIVDLLKELGLNKDQHLAIDRDDNDRILKVSVSTLINDVKKDWKLSGTSAEILQHPAYTTKVQALEKHLNALL